MFWNLHRRCESIDQLLKERILSLESEITRLQDKHAEELAAARASERDLLDRVMVATNPGAYQALVAANRSAAPAAPRPVVERAPRPGSRPVLHPSETRFRGQPEVREPAVPGSPQTITSDPDLAEEARIASDRS